MNRIGLYLCSFTLFLAGCHKEETPVNPELHPASSAKRVVLAYLVSNNLAGNNLDSNLKENIVWMYQGLAAATDTCSLLVFYRPYSSDAVLPHPAILSFTTDGRGRINRSQALSGNELTSTNVLKAAYTEKEYTESDFNATSAETMKTILADMQDLISAPSYGLIFGSHGTGWIKGSYTLPNRSFGDDNRYSINIPEMADAIYKAFKGKKADFILFDACMMGTAEVCYELRNTASYCIASVLETPVDGLPYQKFFPTLYDSEPDYTQVIDEAIAYNTEKRTWGTYAWINLAKMEALAQAVKAELIMHDESAKSIGYSQLLQYGYGNFKYFSFDLIEYIKLLNDGSIPRSFKETFDSAVLYKNSMSDNSYLKENLRYSGMGMYLPDRGIRSAWDTYYPALSWYQAAGWNLIK